MSDSSDGKDSGSFYWIIEDNQNGFEGTIASRRNASASENNLVFADVRSFFTLSSWFVDSVWRS